MVVIKPILVITTTVQVMSKWHGAAMVAAMLILLVSCGTTERYPYFHYEHVESSGWGDRDTLHFNVPLLRDTARYAIILAARLTEDYPYRELTMSAFFHPYPADSITKRCDAVLPTINEKGERTGGGAVYFDGEVTLDTIAANTTDSMRLDSVKISVIHTMNSRALKGVNDIGIRFEKINN